MGDTTRYASLKFKDDDTNNPIISIAFLHTSLKNDEYVNPDINSSEPYSLFKWTKVNSLDFKSEGGWWLAFDAVMINKNQHDVWAVALQRKNNKYVEYLEQKEGFWKKLGEDIVKDVCNAAIDVADLDDGEVSSEEFQKATDKVINLLFTNGDGDVLIKNWVHWSSYEIQFTLSKDHAKMHSKEHDTSCKTERFGN
jgi:hypothetical protein